LFVERTSSITALKVKGVTSDMWGWNAVESLWQDARYAIRGIRRSPALSRAAAESSGACIQS
jgi:hypothetical protein